MIKPKAKLKTPNRSHKRPKKIQEHTWDEAIRIVLKEADGAMHYAEIAEQILENELRINVGATPAATVASYLSTSMQKDDSPYLRVGRGEYTLKSKAEANAREVAVAPATDKESSEAGALRAFGMYWLRDSVDWKATPQSLMGMQGAGATAVNFSAQVGVYLLHDRERVIYVGRATDSLFSRLKVHTTDRLGGRWDRFSWFGLRGVNDDGSLKDHQAPWNHESVVETMEALLIESLEPPLNRRRGDNFSSVEYIQSEDFEFARKRADAMIQMRLGLK